MSPLFLGYVAFLALALAYLLRRLRFCGGSIALALAAMALCALHVMNAPWDRFTSDAEKHLEYVRYVAEHRALPPPMEKAAYRHPGGFYVAAAAFYALGDSAMQSVQYAQLAPFTAYLAFLVFSMLCLRRSVRAPGAYFTGLVLLLFWPTGLTMAGRISCDIALYACVAGMLYFMLLWQERFVHRHLAWALACAGWGFLMKNAMIVWLALFACHAAYHAARRAFTLRSLLRTDVALALAWLAGCMALTMGRTWIARYIPSLDQEWDMGAVIVDFVRQVLFGFDIRSFFMRSVSDVISPETSFLFWNFFLRTLVLDQVIWQSDTLAIWICVLLLSVLLYVLTGVAWMAISQPPARRTLGLLAWIAAGSIGSLIVMLLLVPDHPFYGSARYVYGIVTIIALLYAKSMEWHGTCGRRLLAGLGAALAASFTGVSLALVTSDTLDCTGLGETIRCPPSMEVR